MNHMEEPICSIEISKDESTFTAKVQTGKGRYVEFENEDIEYLLEDIYDDLQMEVEEYENLQMETEENQW